MGEAANALWDFAVAHSSLLLAVPAVFALGMLSMLGLCSRRTAEIEQRALLLKRERDAHDSALRHVPHGLCLYDSADRLICANARFRQLYRLPPSAVTPGTPFDFILRHAIALGHFPGRRPEEVLWERLTYVSRREPGVIQQKLADGRTIQITHNPTEDGGWIATYEDITERCRAEEQLVYLARHDGLTRLPNRAHFRERLEWALSHVSRGRQLAVLYIDIDRFKPINDMFGHDAGDILLLMVGRRLRGCARESDTVARLGSDEFAIVQTDIDRPELAGSLAQRIIAALVEPFDIAGSRLEVAVSVGIAMAPSDGMRPDTLLTYAEQAMRRAKTDGQGSYRLFEREMDQRERERRRIERELRGALDRNELEVFYQPLFDLRSRRIASFEALVRWRHHTGVMVLPGEFIPVAEDSGLIGVLGAFVLRQACQDAAGWPPEIRVAVNMSPSQLRNMSVVETVQTALARARLPPTRLEIEVTESTLLDTRSAAMQVLHALRGMGVRIAIDDFGTGYASLSYLRDFPFDKIKIDRSFIQGLLERPECLAIVRAMLRLAGSLGVSVVAEGVETKEQLACLRAEGCTEAQSFLLGAPMPAYGVRHLLENQGPKEMAFA